MSVNARLQANEIEMESNFLVNTSSIEEKYLVTDLFMTATNLMQSYRIPNRLLETKKWLKNQFGKLTQSLFQVALRKYPKSGNISTMKQQLNWSDKSSLTSVSL